MHTKLTANDIPSSITDIATDLWLVFTGNGLSLKGAFTSIDDATRFVRENIATIPYFQTDKKHDRDDDHSTLPLGAITGLSWDCPSRKMTPTEINASHSIFKENWLRNPPLTSDFEAAAASGVSFVADQTGHVSITRCSRFIGYLYRSGQLNDKTRQVQELVAACEIIVNPK